MTEVHDGPNERIPVLAGARRHRCLCKRSDRIGAVSYVFEHPLRRTGTHTGNKMHQPKARDTIARVLDEPQQRQYILDMSGIKKLQTTKLDEWDVAAGQLECQHDGGLQLIRILVFGYENTIKATADFVG